MPSVASAKPAEKGAANLALREEPNSFSDLPALDTPSLNLFTFVSANFFKSFLVCSAAVPSFSKFFSVAIISLCRASYCPWVILPNSRAFLACSAAVLSICSFSSVVPIA